MNITDIFKLGFSRQTSSTLADKAEEKWQGSGEALRTLIFLKHDLHEYLRKEVTSNFELLQSFSQNGLENKTYVNAQQFLTFFFSPKEIWS